MDPVTAGVVGAAVLMSLPYWLPAVVVAARVRIFGWLGGGAGVVVPGRLVDAGRLKEVYAHPAANGRSRGAVLSDLFWYWLSPGAHLHQEHLEAGPRYTEVARATRRILHAGGADAVALTRRCVARVLDEQDLATVTLVRLRDLLMPVWVEYYHELVFGTPCPRLARRLMVAHADDVVTALKCCGLRHMDRRHQLTRYLTARVAAGDAAHRLPAGLTTEEQALYLQGTFFTTAVVQMTDATAHLLMVVAQHPRVRARLLAEPDDDGYLDNVIDETLRLYPLFGVAHRVTTADIAVEPAGTIPAGSVVCFNYPQYHRSGFTDPGRFDPDRWLRLSARDVHHIPFGVPANRPCPARQLAPLTMRVAAREVLARVDLRSSARHSRSMPNRGPCLLLPVASRPAGWRVAALLGYLRVRDRVEDVWRSVAQLVLGTYMVLDARRLSLCARYFQANDADGPLTAASP